VKHPRTVLHGPQARIGVLPVCDHYSGVELRMRKSLELQAEMIAEFGACVFDVTLDCEDGAPVGGEREHLQMALTFAAQTMAKARRTRPDCLPRIAVRVHPVRHGAFAHEMETLATHTGRDLCHIMLPKVESVRDVDHALASLSSGSSAQAPVLPLHVLLESAGAVHHAFEIAAHPRVQSISFGLMDFVSSHGGAIPAEAMSGDGQFVHPMVVRAKLEVAAACHAHGKTPSHCVVTEFKNTQTVQQAARRAAGEFGYTRMWSIHPAQIRPILAAFAPQRHAVEVAAEIILKAQRENWAPISHAGQLHDRASYRLFWQTLELAHRTGGWLPDPVLPLFSDISLKQPL